MGFFSPHIFDNNGWLWKINNLYDMFRLLGRGECAGLMVEGVGIDMRIRYG